MTIKHKILVSKETGKMIFPVHTIDDPRPEPLDAKWIPIDSVTAPALYGHFSMDPPNDASHIDLYETYWDFDLNEWVEVSAPEATNFEKVKFSRNELLKQSDKHIVDATSPEERAAWMLYRQQLRDMFVGTPPDFEWSKVIFPRNPVDIQTLKDLAAAGDTFAAEIIERDGL